MNEDNNKCPECGSTRFVTNLNQYDVLEFNNGGFDIIRSESTDGETKVFCEECCEEIDFDGSIEKGKITFANQ